MDEEPLFTICYISSIVAQLSEADIKLLIEQSADANSHLNITGCIGIRRSEVVQVLEGPRGVVEALFRRIQSDPRHSGVTIMASSEIERRRFEGWGMKELPYGTVVEAADQIRSIHQR